MDPQVTTSSHTLVSSAFIPVTRIFSANCSAVAGSSAGVAKHGKAPVRVRISSIGSTSHWKNCIVARPPNLLSHGTLFVLSARERGERKALSNHAAPAVEGVFGSHSARWVL